MPIEKLKREYVGARVTERAVKNCEYVALQTGLSFSRVIERAMELITTNAIVEIIIKEQKNKIVNTKP